MSKGQTWKRCLGCDVVKPLSHFALLNNGMRSRVCKHCSEMGIRSPKQSRSVEWVSMPEILKPQYWRKCDGQ